MKTFLAVFNSLPAILESVQAIEAAIPLPRAGQQKMNLVLNAAATAWAIGQVAEQQTLSKTTTLSSVQALTNVAVASLNSAGVFAQGTAAPAASAAPVSSN